MDANLEAKAETRILVAYLLGLFTMFLWQSTWQIVMPWILAVNP